MYLGRIRGILGFDRKTQDAPPFANTRGGSAYEKEQGMSTEDFPTRVRIERKKRHWTQQDLADRTGVSLRAIQNYEGGKSVLQAPNLRTVLAALDIDPDDDPPGDEVAAETRNSWPAEVSVFLDMLGAYLMTMPEERRLRSIHDMTRMIFNTRHTPE